MNPIPPLTDTEIGMLRESIRRDGVQYPILLDASGAIIDGHHRKQICEQLGKDCPAKTLNVDADTAERLSVTLNLARRQLKPADAYELIAWLAERHQADADADAKARAIEGNRRGGEGKSTASMEVDFPERGPTASEAVAEKINADLADLGETMRVNKSRVERAQRWSRASAADKAAVRAGHKSATEITDPGQKQERGRRRTAEHRNGNNHKRTSKRAPARTVTPQHLRDSQAETRAMYAETQYQSMLNAPKGTLNLPMLRRAETIQLALDDLLELDPVDAAGQMPAVRTPTFPTDTAEWWSLFAAACEQRWQNEVPHLQGRRRSRLTPLAEKDLTRGDGQLLDWLRTQTEPVTAIETAVAVQINENTARMALRRLVDAGLAAAVGYLGEGRNSRILYAAAAAAQESPP